MSWTLNIYIARAFLIYMILVFLSVFALIMVVDLIELIRENRRGTASFIDLLGIAALRTPLITIKAAPFTVLLAAMACFSTLARRSELVVTRAVGVSAFRIVLPALFTSVLMGVFSFAAYNPLASAFATRYESLQERYFNRSLASLTVADDAVWLRQGDETGQTVIRAERSNEFVDYLWKVSVFQFDIDDHLYRRIEARSAKLEDRKWRFNGVSEWEISAIGKEPGEAAPLEKTSDVIRIPTELTREQIAESFASPDTISFWKLPDFIALLEKSGLSTNRHRVHFINLLAMPLIFVAMVLISASLSMRHARFGGLGVMALNCVLAGFGYFFFSDVMMALGASGAVPTTLAGWTPPFVATLLALGLLLHLEDG